MHPVLISRYLYIEETVKKLTKEREALQETVDAQDLSPADVDRLNAERDQLAKSLALTSQNLDTVTKQVWTQEIALQKKMDILERCVDKVNALLYKIEVLGSKDPMLESVSREIEIFVQQSRPDSMVSVNLRGQVKVRLMNNLFKPISSQPLMY
jgi:kinetochore protein NDC80